MASKHINLQTPWFPSNYIMAVINEPEDAVAAVAALENDEGVHAEHILLLHGKEAVECIDIKCEDCGLLKQMLRLFWRFVTYEGYLLSEYEEAGRAGSHVLALHMPQPDHLERARDIMTAHHAYRIEYFEQKAIRTMTQLAL